MTNILKCISIRQPWAWLILRPDIIGDEARKLARLAGKMKDIENRPKRWNVRGKVFIHASGYVPYESECSEIEQQFGITLPDSFDVGGIVGTVDIVDCVTVHPSRWFFGQFGLLLRDARPCEFFPCRGQLGLFTVPNVPEDLHQRPPVNVSVVTEPKLF